MITVEKNLIIIAGVNGAGKTTFAKPYSKELKYPFLNADEIAKGLEEKGEKYAMIKAGRIFFQRLHSYLEPEQHPRLENRKLHYD